MPLDPAWAPGVSRGAGSYGGWPGKGCDIPGRSRAARGRLRRVGRRGSPSRLRVARAAGVVDAGVVRRGSPARRRERPGPSLDRATACNAAAVAGRRPIASRATESPPAAGSVAACGAWPPGRAFHHGSPADWPRALPRPRRPPTRCPPTPDNLADRPSFRMPPPWCGSRFLRAGRMCRRQVPADQSDQQDRRAGEQHQRKTLDQRVAAGDRHLPSGR